MPNKKKAKANKAVKEIIKQQVEEVKKLPPMDRTIKREMNMDNVLIEIFWKKQAEGESYVYPHLRGVDYAIILDKGPMVTNPSVKKGRKVVMSAANYGVEVDRDEVSALSVVKPHEIMFFI